MNADKLDSLTQRVLGANECEPSDCGILFSPGPPRGTLPLPPCKDLVNWLVVREHPPIPHPGRRKFPPSKPPASATKHHLSSRLPPPLPTPRHQPPSHALSVSSSPGTSRNNPAIPPPWRLRCAPDSPPSLQINGP